MTRPRLLITRPAAAAISTAAAARAAGFSPIIAPLLTITPLPFAPPSARPDAIMFTSAEAPPLLAAEMVPGVPAWAVGNRTGEAARAAGFPLVGSGSSNASALLLQMAAAGHRHILHPCGRDRAPMTVPAGLTVEPLIVYAAEAVPELPPPAAAALTEPESLLTLLFSARTARIFTGLVDRAGIARDQLALVFISEPAAAAAGDGWLCTAIADRPSSAGALAAAHRLWQDMAHG